MRWWINIDLSGILANVLITLGILLLATSFFPQYYIVDGIGAMIWLSIVWGILSLVVSLLVIGIGAMGVLSICKTTTGWVIVIILAAIAIMMSNVVALMIINHWSSSVNIIGFWPKIALAIAKGIATLTKGTRESG